MGRKKKEPKLTDTQEKIILYMKRYNDTYIKTSEYYDYQAVIGDGGNFTYYFSRPTFKALLYKGLLKVIEGGEDGTYILSTEREEKQIKEEEDESVCESCGKPDTDLHQCEGCDQLIGYCCQATYDQFTQIDYNCCKSCAENGGD